MKLVSAIEKFNRFIKDERGATGTAVATGDWITAAKMNLKQEDGSALTVLGVLDQTGTGTEDLRFTCSENLGATKTLDIKPNGADRTLDLTGNLTIAGNLTTTVGAISLAADSGGTSSLTLPASGTVATLAGTEELTNKTVTSATLSGTFTASTSVVNFTTGSITFTTGFVSISGAGYVSIAGAGYVRVGANAASTGYFRISNAQYLTARNAANDGDISMVQVSANNFVKFGTTSLEIATANVVTLAFSNPAATRTITFGDPGAADSVVYLAANQTLTTKTLTSPTINAATLSGTFSGAITFSGATITLTGNLLNFTAGAAYTLGTTDSNTLAIKTNNTARWTWAAASANVTIASAAILVIPAATATSLSIQDGTTKMIDLDTRATTDGVKGVTLTGAPATFASAAGSAWSSVYIPTVALTMTGGTGVTALNGVSLNIVAPTVVSGSATTVTTASTVYISNAPQGGGAGPLAITNAYALHVAAGTTALQATSITGTLTLTNAGAVDIIVQGTSPVIDIGADVLAAGYFISIDYDTAETTTGDLYLIDALRAANALTLGADLYGINLNFNSNVTGAADRDIIGYRVLTPALTANAANTTVYTGFQLPTAGALVGQNAGGTLTFYGMDLQLPNITQTAGTVTATGIRITEGTTTSGTATGITINVTKAITFSKASTLTVFANAAATLDLSDGTANLLRVNSQTTTDNVVTFTVTGQAVTIANGAGTTYNTVKVAAHTVTISTATGVTAMSGIGLYLDAPTVTSATNPAVALASTLYVAAPVAGGTATITAGYSAHFASAIRLDGNLTMNNAAYDLVIKADTAAAFEIYDATTKIVAVDSRVTTDAIVGITITGPAVTVAAANGSTYSAVSIAARTHTFTGNTAVTAMNGLQLNLGAPTITSAGTPAVAIASTLYVAAPVAAGTATITANYAGHFAGAVRIDGNVDLANAAYDIIVKANTAACLEIYDATTKLLTVNDQTGTDNAVGFTFTGSPTSYASAGGSTYSVAKIAAHTATLTGGTGVTAMSGLGLYIDTPTVTSAAATTVALASTLYVAAPAAAGAGPVTITTGYSAHFASAVRIDGSITMSNAANDIIVIANTAAALEISDGTTKLLTFDSRNTVTGVIAANFSASAATIVSAAGVTYSQVGVAAKTTTITGTDAVTALEGLQLYLDVPTVTNVSAGLTLTTGSTLYVALPVATGNATFTTAYTIHANGAMKLDGNLVMNAAGYDIVMKANTATALEISDGTAKYLAIDTRTATDNITAHTFDCADSTFASANGSTWRLVTHAAATVNVTGGVQVTAMDGLSLYMNQIIIAANQATTVVTASTLYLTPPGLGANIAITNNYIINTSVAGCFCTAGGVWTSVSGRKFKTAIKSLNLETVPKLLSKINLVSYKRIDPTDGGATRYGVIADEAPDFLTSKDRNGIAAIDMAGVALAGVKYLEKKIEELQKENKELKALIAG